MISSSGPMIGAVAGLLFGSKFSVTRTGACPEMDAGWWPSSFTESDDVNAGPSTSPGGR